MSVAEHAAVARERYAMEGRSFLCALLAQIYHLSGKVAPDKSVERARAKLALYQSQEDEVIALALVAFGVKLEDALPAPMSPPVEAKANHDEITKSLGQLPTAWQQALGEVGMQKEFKEKLRQRLVQQLGKDKRQVSKMMMAISVQQVLQETGLDDVAQAWEAQAGHFWRKARKGRECATHHSTKWKAKQQSTGKGPQKKPACTKHCAEQKQRR